MIIKQPHSIVHLITNSSTEIYTDYTNTVSAIEELFNEFLKAFNINNITFSEIYSCDVLYSVSDYVDYITTGQYADDVEEQIKELISIEDEDELYSFVEKTLTQYDAGEIDKPNWLTVIKKELDVLNSYRDCPQYSEFSISVKQNICEKDKEKYKELANKIINLIYSPVSSAYYC